MDTIAKSRGAELLVLGDLIAFLFSLILTLTVRYGGFPTRELLLQHLPSFLVLFFIFILLNFSIGMYDKQLVFVRGRVHGLLIQGQILNAVVGVVFFYFAPVAIAPKANLLIYFLVSTALLFLWRVIMHPVLSVAKKQECILVGTGPDIEDLKEEIKAGSRYGLNIARHLDTAKASDLAQELRQAVEASKASIVVADLNDKRVQALMPILYRLIFSRNQVVDASKLYESVFDRIPIGMVGERWLIENSASLGNRRIYDVLKRATDIAISFIAGLVSLIFYPFVIAAIKLEDGGPIFIEQNRIGQSGKPVKIIKFRSMTGNDDGNYGKEGVTKLKDTKVGKILRKSRIDEFPQFWNVIAGDLSLVGPRPELPNLFEIYDREIPHYNARHLVKPGLCGWAQIYHEAHPHHEIGTNETRNKLSYDLFYIKNRSFTLDLKIVLRTMQIVLKAVGR